MRGRLEVASSVVTGDFSGPQCQNKVQREYLNTNNSFDLCCGIQSFLGQICYHCLSHTSVSISIEEKYYMSDEYVQGTCQELFNQKLYERLLRTYQLGSAVRHIIHMPHPPSANATRG